MDSIWCRATSRKGGSLSWDIRVTGVGAGGAFLLAERRMKVKVCVSHASFLGVNNNGLCRIDAVGGAVHVASIAFALLGSWPAKCSCGAAVEATGREAMRHIGIHLYVVR